MFCISLAYEKHIFLQAGRKVDFITPWRGGGGGGGQTNPFSDPLVEKKPHATREKD